MYYETEGMAEIRAILTASSVFQDSDVDTFKRCLVALEKRGFKLTLEVNECLAGVTVN